MAQGCFHRCHDVTAKWEGGWSDHPADPGGKTMYGITLAKFREHYPNATAAQLRAMTRSQAEAIYIVDFWQPMNGEKLSAGVDLAAYDAAVNSGVGRSKKWLLASLGGDAATTVKRMCAKRLGFMQSLKIWKNFGKGWARRVADIEAKGVAWALAAAGGSLTGQKVALTEEANAATKKVVKHDAGAVASTSTAAGTGFGSINTADHTASTVLLVLLGVLLLTAVIFAIRAHIHSARKDAYLAEADKL